MTCREALALIHRGEQSLAAAHITTCPECSAQCDREERVIALARAALAIEVPANHAALVVRAALASPKAHVVPWWDLALPIAWRAAIALNVAGAIVLAWTLFRAPPQPEPQPAATADSYTEDVLEDEVSAMLDRALGEGGAP